MNEKVLFLIILRTAAWDATSNTFTFTGNMVCPSSGKDIAVKETLKIVDDNHEELAMYIEAGGHESKNMEIKMVRK